MSESPEPFPALSRRELGGLATLLGVLFVWTLSPLAGFDFWFYLAMGREIVETGKIPYSQSFLGSTTALGFGRYADQAWLGNLVCYGCFWLGGFAGLVLLKSALLIGTTGVVYVCCRWNGLAPFWAGVWSTLGLWSIRGRFEMRTYLLTDLCLALFVAIMIATEKGWPPRRAAFALFALFAVWTNLHQGILAGFVAIGCWWVFGRLPIKTRTMLFFTGLAGSLVKPHALEFPGFIYDHFTNSRAIGGVVEWAPPPPSTMIYQLGPMYVGMAAIAVFGGLHLWKLRRWPPWAFGLMALFFAALAARSIRSISELLPVVCPLAAAYAPPLPGSRRVQAGAALMVGMLLFSTFASRNLRRLSVVDGFPEALVRALPAQHGQLFNSFEFGNFLVYKKIPPFIHGMSGLYRERLITDFEAVLNPTPQRWEIMRNFGVGSVLLHLPQPEGDATLNIVDTLADNPDWKLELWDDTGLLFLPGKREDGLTAVRPWRSPSWTDDVAAEAELQRLIAGQPSAIACRMLSQLLLKRGEISEATAIANQAVELSPNFYPSWAQLGLCYARAGNMQGLLTASEGGVKAAPTLASAHFNRALALSEQARVESGLSAVWHRWAAKYQARRAIWLDPTFAPARRLVNSL